MRRRRLHGPNSWLYNCSEEKMPQINRIIADVRVVCERGPFKVCGKKMEEIIQ
jgi:hypothetical protein